MPLIEDTGIRGRVVIGSFEGLKSPVKVFSDTLYADINIQSGAKFPFAAAHGESDSSEPLQSSRTYWAGL